MSLSVKVLIGNTSTSKYIYILYFSKVYTNNIILKFQWILNFQCKNIGIQLYTIVYSMIYFKQFLFYFFHAIFVHIQKKRFKMV